MRTALVLAFSLAPALLHAGERPAAEMLRVEGTRPEPGPRITPFLRYQLDRAWEQDEARRAAFAAVRTEADLRALRGDLRAKVLDIIGGLPEERAPLHARVTGTLPREGYRIERVVFESLPGLHVTALLYVPEAPAGPKPAVLVACGHAPLGKAHPGYQELSARLAKRGYVVLCFDPVGQGERSQFWDVTRGRSRYNLVCGEHAVLGNLCTLAGLSLVRFMVWDGVRGLDYLESRPEVDRARLAVTGTSGGGFQTTWIAALDDRVRVALPSCFPTALPMRMANRIFEDPDSDPEQDPPGLVSRGVDHPGLLLLTYPRPLHFAAAVKDFFPIEGTRRTFRELRALYGRFGRGADVAMAEGYHDHQYSPENQAAAFAFLDRAFGLPVRGRLDPVTPLPAEELRVTPTGQVRVDLPGRSLVDIVREEFRSRKGEAAASLADWYRGDGAPRVGEWTLVPYMGPPGPGTLAWEKAGSSEVGTTVVDRFRLHHSGGLVLPLLHLRPSKKPALRTVVRLGLAGHIRPEDWPEVESLIARGDALVSFDARGLGETRMDYKAVSIDDPELAKLDDEAAYVSPISGVLANHVYNALLTGRPYFFQLLDDAEIACRFAREVLGAQRLAVTGRGESHLWAAAAASLLPQVELVPPAPGDASFSWSAAVEEGRELWPIAYLVPGGAYLRLNDARSPSE
jgi:dienelactone hydrolase